LLYPFELIVVDNGSTDGTVEYLKLMKDLNYVHHLVLNGENKGIAIPKQQGLEIAKKIVGKDDKYVVLTDNDIVVPFVRDNGSCVLTKMIQIMDRHLEIGMMGVDLNRDNCPEDTINWWYRLRQHPLDNPEYCDISIGFWFALTRMEYFNRYSFDNAGTSLYGRVDESYRNNLSINEKKKVGLFKGISLKDKNGKHLETISKVGLHLGWKEDLGNEYSNFKKSERNKANKKWDEIGKKW